MPFSTYEAENAFVPQIRHARDCRAVGTGTDYHGICWVNGWPLSIMHRSLYRGCIHTLPNTLALRIARCLVCAVTEAEA